MKRSEIEAIVRTVLERLTKMDLSEVGLGDDLGEAIGLDSLGKLELLAEVEDHFDLTFLEADTEGASTIDAMIDTTLNELARTKEVV